MKHVENITWGEPFERLGGSENGPLLVYIGGLWGTVCFDGFDENAVIFFCENLVSGGYGIDVERVNHEEVRFKGKPEQQLPVLLTNVQCDENAATPDDCTSGPMGYSNCPSGDDVKLVCSFIGPG